MSRIDGQGAITGEQLDDLAQRWNEVVSLRQSVHRFRCRIQEAAPVVAELAASFPELRDAASVVKGLMTSVSLAEDVLQRTRIRAVLHPNRESPD